MQLQPVSSEYVICNLSWDVSLSWNKSDFKDEADYSRVKMGGFRFP